MVGEIEERLRLITETISEVFWMVTRDFSRTLYVSPAYEKIYGRSIESVYDNARTFLDAIHPHDRDAVARAVVEQRDRPFDVEYRIVHPDGTIRWISDRGYPVLAGEDQVPCYAGVARDITEHKAMQSEIAEINERFRLAATVTQDGIFDWNMVTNTAWWSDAMYTTFGMDRSMTPAFEPWAACIHPDDRERVLAGFKRALERDEDGWSDEYRFIRPDGKTLHVLDRAAVLRDASGKPVRMIGALMDITERRTLEDQLRHSQKMEAIGQLAGGVAHDFNNLIQAGMLGLTLVQSTAGLPPRASAYVSEVRHVFERAASLTRQLLVFSRREAMRPRRIDLNEQVLELTHMLRRMIGEHIALELGLSRGSIAIEADPAMLDQVLINLSVNARDAMPRGGTLAISTELAGERACILVRDTGSGIAESELPRIFEPFFTTKEPGRGTGLGLAMVHGIVEQHRGVIEVESQPGKGTTFRVFLPLTQSTVTARDDKTSIRPSNGDETILLVEDEDIVRRALRAVLEGAGYRVVEAERADAALTLWDQANGEIDLVLTDMVMPGEMSGRDLAAQLVARSPDVRIVFMTGYARDGEPSDHALVQKPIEAESLLAVVRGSFDR